MTRKPVSRRSRPKQAVPSDTVYRRIRRGWNSRRCDERADAPPFHHRQRRMQNDGAMVTGAGNQRKLDPQPPYSRLDRGGGRHPPDPAKAALHDCARSYFDPFGMGEENRAACADDLSPPQGRVESVRCDRPSAAETAEEPHPMRLQCQPGTDELNHAETRYVVNNVTWQVALRDC